MNYNWYPDDYQMNIKRDDSSHEPKVVEVKPKKKMKPWVLVLISVLATSLVFSAAVVPYINYRIARVASGSAVIFRDGSDLRDKVDGSALIGVGNISSDGKTPMSVVDIARRVGPAVVGIVCSAETVGSIFLIPQTSQSSGSGIIISSDGYIVTNNHVVEGANAIKVILNNHDEYDAKLVGTDEQTDLAVIKIEATELTTAVLGNSSDVEVGELAIAIGNPLGQELAGTVTTGIISATNRLVSVDGKEFTLLQTDAAINSGNSGGALVNAYGEVIGINSVKMAASGVEGLGFAIPSDVAKPIISDLMSVGYVQGRPVIGIMGRNLTEEQAKYYNYPVGIYVTNIVEFSGAEKAGIRIGDVITGCNGKKIKTITELNEIRDTCQVGDIIKLTVVRDGKEMEVDVVLGEDKPDSIVDNNNNTQNTIPDNGLGDLYRYFYGY